MDKIARTILVVDDSPEDRALYRRYLQRDPDYDYRLLEAPSEQQGMALWQQHSPDVVLLDYRLPQLTGLEFLAQLQPLLHRPCPVIMVTGQGNEAIAVQAMKSGVQDYVVKGQITPEGLRLTINSAIETAHLRAQLTQRLQRDRLISQITQKIHQTLDLDEILQTTVSEVRQFLATDRVLIFRLQPEGWGRVQTESVGESWTPLLSTSYQDPCLNTDYIERFRQGGVTLKSNIHDGSIDPCHVELLAKLQVQANLVVPILQREQLWGLLVAHHCASPRQWQPIEIELLKEIATHVGIALQQAELYQRSQAELAERKLAEETLRESEEFKKRMLDSTPDCIKVLDLDGRLLYMNKNGMKTMEIDDFADFLNAEWFCFWEDDYRQLAENAFAAAKAGETGVFNGYCPTAKGTPKWWEVIVSPIWDAAGQVERIMSISRDVSDRVQSERQLKESESRLKLAYKTTQSGLWDWDMIQNRAYISEEYCALFGLDAVLQDVDLSAYDFSYEQWLNQVHPEDRDLVMGALSSVLQQQQQYYECDYRILHPEGVRWVAARGQAFFDAGSGHATRMLGNVQDITERKQADLALHRSEWRTREILDSLYSFVGVLTPNGILSEVNRTVIEASDFPIEEVIGKPFADAYWWAHSTEIQDQLREAIGRAAAGETVRYDTVVRVKGDRLITVDFTIVPVFNAAGQVDYMIPSAIDITERKQIEEALRSSEGLLRLALESAHAGTWEWDLATNNVIASSEIYELFGLDPTQAGLCYEDCINAIHPEDRERVNTEVSQAAQQISPKYCSEFRVVHAQQDIRWLLGQGSVSLDAAGNPYKMSGINLDITERKQIEAQQQSLLLREQAAREEAEKANRIKDEFLAVVSHELRTPLNPILGWSQLLKRGQLNAEKTEYALDTIVRNAKTQAQLVDDLLDVSRILRGKLSLKKALIDPVVVIRTALETVRLAAEAKSIDMQTQLAWTEGRILGDESRLQQIIWNLASNAIKFTPSGGRVDIRLQRVEDQAEITISDTGKGIPSEFLPYVFDRFWQQDAATTRQFGGLGLGLAIVRSLVELHGGTVRADSAGEGQGTTFTLRLPLRLKSSVVSQSIQPLRQSMDLTGVQVLIVDDNVDTRDIVCCVLEQVGATVIALSSASEALATLKQSLPDVLISDIGMPDIDGYMFMRQVRALALDQGGQVPAIALTAYAGEIDYQQAMASGFQRHLTKPVEPDILVEAISKLIRSSG